LYYGNAAAPMATGVLSASASPNTVYYDLNGTQTVKGATYDNLILSSGGTKTLNVEATVNDDFIINSGVLFNPAGNNFTVNDTTIIFGTFADGTTAGTTNLQYVELNGGTINGGATGVVNIHRDLNITSNNGTIGRVDLFVIGTTRIYSGITLTLNSNTGVKTFGAIENNGTWVSTTITTAANLVLQNGIENNGDSFTAGACTFSTNNQEISGDTELSFSSAVTIAGAITVANKISNGITITGVLNGNNAASTWENDINSVLYYRNATVPMATGVLSVDASPNIVYYDLNGAQAVKGATYDNLILSSGGTKTLTVVTTVNDDFIINSGVSFNPAGNDFTVSDTTLIYGTFADGTAAGTTNLQYTELNGGTINGGRTGIVNILGDLDITNGDGTIGQVALTVSGITTIGSGRTLTLNSNTGVKTFGAIENNGTWVSTTITTAANLVLQNGIENNGDSFTAGACTFSTNNQEISGDTELSFSSAVTIAGAITVTNKISNGITMTGALTGDNAASTWENDINTILYYGNAAAPMATGVLSADASPNTVYYDLNGAQAVKGAIYDNLILSSGGAKTLNAEATVNDDFIINAGVSFNPTSYNFTVSDTTIIYGTFADANTTGTTNLQYVELIGGVINGGADGIVNILGDFDVINGDGIIGRVWLTVNGTTTIESGRSLTLNNNIGIRTFAGVLENYGTWVSTTIITPANLVFQNGIENNGDSFTAGAITFDVNNQELRGSTSFMFTGAVYLASGIELTNNATVAITSTSVGALGGATWIQAENSTLNYSGQTITVFSLDATATGNTISYNRAGAQTVFNTVSGKYFNLNFATSNTKTLSANIDIEGDLSISDNAVFSVGTYDINIAGNWNNSSNAADPFTEGTRTVTFDGTSAQTIYNTGDADGTGFYNFTIDNTFPDEALTLNARVNIAGTLNLQEGHIVTDATNILALGTNASVSISASPDESFVKGPMINTYNVSASAVTKIFPIGQGNKMHRTDLTIRQTNTTATEYTADFIYSGADDLGFDLPGTIDKVSEVDQWIISNGGASNVNTASVTLFYNGEDVVDDPSNLRVVKDDGAGNWIDLGGSGSASTEGEITTSVNFTDMGIFTLANAKDGNNPLPIELLSFDANVKNDYVITEWTTASEINNDYFTVERSTNAQDFEIVEIISGAGNSNQVINYSLTDVNPYSGISYYRLKQTDFDGVYSYSNIVAVKIVSKNELTLTAWQNGSNLFLSLISDIIGQLKIEIFDCTGKLVLQKSDFIENNESIIQLDKSGFMPGMYIIRLTLGSSQKSVKVFIN
ncbi:MAG TPA: T9SS type A sorting domain-containing protein, partial [Bacteroidales bacterium]|nr:T9SS type A sorting domain-containing protein [Bacteroidales bacterium]